MSRIVALLVAVLITPSPASAAAPRPTAAQAAAAAAEAARPGVPKLTRPEAKKQLKETLDRAVITAGPSTSAPSRVVFSAFRGDGYTTTVNGEPTTILYRDLGDVRTDRGLGGYHFVRYTLKGVLQDRFRTPWWLLAYDKDAPAIAARCAEAINALRYYYLEEARTSTSLTPEFRAMAAQARGPGAAKPPAEITDRYNFQAGAAVKEGDFDDAIAILTRGVEAVPASAPFHFDLAVLMGETERYNSAILHMKMYLELSPDAPDAREAQGRIFTWERKAEVFQVPAAPAPPSRVRR